MKNSASQIQKVCIYSRLQTDYSEKAIRIIQFELGGVIIECLKIIETKNMFNGTVYNTLSHWTPKCRTGGGSH